MPDRETLAAAAMKRAATSSISLIAEKENEKKTESLGVSTERESHLPAQVKREGQAKEKEEEQELPRRFQALKAWLRTVCKFRTVVIYGNGDEADPLLLTFLNLLLESQARFKDAIVLSGGMESLRCRYTPLLISSDLLLPGPTEIIPPCSFPSKKGRLPKNMTKKKSFFPTKEGGSEGAGSSPSPRFLGLRKKKTERKSCSSFPPSSFSVFSCSSPKILHDNADILHHFGIEVIINLTSVRCPLPADTSLPSSSSSVSRRLYQLSSSLSSPSSSSSSFGVFEVHNLPFGEPASFPFSEASNIIRQAKERDLGVLVYDYQGEKSTAAGVIAWYLIDEGFGVIQTLNHIKLRLPLLEMNPGMISELHRHAETLAKIPSLQASPSSYLNGRDFALPGERLSSLQSSSTPLSLSPHTLTSTVRKGCALGLYSVPLASATPSSSSASAAASNGACLDDRYAAGAVGIKEEGEDGDRTEEEERRSISRSNPFVLSHTSSSLSTEFEKTVVSVWSAWVEKVRTEVIKKKKNEEGEETNEEKEGGQEEKNEEDKMKERETEVKAVVERSLYVLREILANILLHPNDEKYRQIKMSNRKFYESVGVFPRLLQLLFT
ncbi:pub domain-containing protein, partial [Cystoisospora suis]